MIVMCHIKKRKKTFEFLFDPQRSSDSFLQGRQFTAQLGSIAFCVSTKAK